MDTDILEKIGFTKGEIKVYFSLLKLGNTSTGPVIKESGIAGSKVYDILEKLKGKGLISETMQGKVRYFRAFSPKRIVDYIDEREKEIKLERKEFEKVLPFLMNKHKELEEKYEVKVYEGYSGIKTFYEEMASSLSKKDEYLGFAFSKKAFSNSHIVRLFDLFHKERAKKGSTAKILCKPNDTLNKSRVEDVSDSLYEFRVTTFPFPSGVSIFKDTVATFSWGKVPRIFSITSKAHAKEYRDFFMSIWNANKA